MWVILGKLYIVYSLYITRKLQILHHMAACMQKLHANTYNDVRIKWGILACDRIAFFNSCRGSARLIAFRICVKKYDHTALLRKKT